MARKVIIDGDPGIDVAMGLSLALFAPEIEVLAVTAVGGKVEAEQSTLNVQLVIEQLDAPRLPRVGAARAVGPSLSGNAQALHGQDGLGNSGFTTSKLHHQHPSDKVIADTVHSAPHNVTLICLGPLTNVAAAFQRDPDLPSLVDQVVIAGGTICAPGNVTATAEFNVYCDVAAARAVLHAPVRTTIVPLDATRAVKFELDLIEALPSPATRVGRFLRAIVPYLFRVYHERLGLEHIYLDALVAVAAILYPELAHIERWPCDVETAGELTYGQMVFDRRPNASQQATVEVIESVDAEPLRSRIVSGLQRAAS